VRELFETIFTPVDRWLGAVPLAAARWLTLAYLITPCCLLFLLDEATLWRGAPRRAARYDLRLWSVVATIPYALIYLFW
jgi:hypothetical protein